MNTLIASPGERLKHLRKISRLSRSQISQKYGISANTLKSWENATQNLSDRVINQCVDIYRDQGILFSHEWLAQGTGFSPKSFEETIKRPIPLPSESHFQIDNQEELHILKEISFFKELYPDAAVMIVSNNDMFPFYKGGDYVCGRWISYEQIFKAINHDCIIQLTNGTKYFRRLVQDNNGFLNIACLNPTGVRYEPVLYNVNIERAAPVIWHRKIHN